MVDQESREQTRYSHQNISDRFRVESCYKSLPLFEEKDIENFFRLFERKARELEWPRDKWHLIAQNAFKGKALEAFSVLDDEQARDYDQIKQAVLRAYEITSEAHRQKFRSLKKEESETYAEFIAKKSNMFDRWVRSEKADSKEEIREIIVMEEIKNHMPLGLKMLLSDQKVSSLAVAGETADNYVLAHKDNRYSHGSVNHNNAFHKSAGRNHDHSHNHHRNKVGEKTRSFHQDNQRVNQKFSNDFRQNSRVGTGQLKCTYCNLTNHTVDKCYKKQRDTKAGIGVVKGKFIPEKLKRYVHKAKIASGKDGKVREVAVYRDTGAWQTLMLSSALPEKDKTATGSYAIIGGIGEEAMSVPIHKIWITGEYISGEVEIGIVNKLPLEGVDILLGNDLTDSCCHKKCSPALRVNIKPVENTQTPSEQTDLYPACVTTRSMSKAKVIEEETNLDDTWLATKFNREEETKETPREVVKTQDLAKIKPVAKQALKENSEEINSKVDWNPQSLRKAQQLDQTLKQAWDELFNEKEEKCDFFVRKDILMRRCSRKEAEESTREQVVVPKEYRDEIMSLAHEGLFAGHLGRTKTYERVSADFYWPGMYKDVDEYIKTCHICQVSGKPNQVIPPAPLKTVPIVGEAFSKVLIDIVGPLPRTSQGNQYILTVMCMTTRFPEAIPLRKITATVVAKSLVKYFTMTGLPTEIQSDQGSNFMSRVFRQTMQLLEIHQVRSSAYHPESQGALERFHQNLKTMLRCYSVEHERDWDVCLPYVLFAARDSKQESLGFTPFELVYGHTPRGPLKLVKEKWIEGNIEEDLLGYVARIKSKLLQATSLAKQHLSVAQSRAKAHFDKSAKTREFKVGDQVLLYLPIPKSPLKAKYYGPYKIKRRVSDVCYVISTPDRRRKERVCHINLVKPYKVRSTALPISLITAMMNHHDRESPSEIVEPKLSCSPEQPNGKPTRYGWYPCDQGCGSLIPTANINRSEALNTTTL